MIDWIPISNPPEMVEVDDTPLWLAGKPMPPIRSSGPVLLAIDKDDGRRRITVGRVCFADGHPEPFERIYGRRIVAWAHINWPGEK